MKNLPDIIFSIFIILILFVKMSIAQYSMAESSTDQSLPVELVSFSIQQDEFAVSLNWITASELDNIGFVIERKSSSDLLFVEIASFQSDSGLIGQGNSTQLHEYHFKDFVEKEGTYFYRLYQMDSNGSRNFIAEKNINIELSNTNNFSLVGIYPNPFNSVTQIEFYLPASFRTEIAIYNITGQKIDDISTDVLERGIHKVKWDASSLPAGFYFLNICYQNKQIARKVLYLK